MLGYRAKQDLIDRAKPDSLPTEDVLVVVSTFEVVVLTKQVDPCGVASRLHCRHRHGDGVSSRGLQTSQVLKPMVDHVLRAIAQRLLVDQRDGEGPNTRLVELQVQGPSVPLGNECRDKALECGWQLPEVVNVQFVTSCG